MAKCRAKSKIGVASWDFGHVCGRARGHKGNHRCTYQLEWAHGKTVERVCNKQWKRKGEASR